MKSIRVALSLVAFAPLATAQLPPDHGVMFNSYGNTHDAVDVFGGGTVTPLGGLFGPVTGAGAGFLDPVTGELWMGGCFGGSLGAVYRIELSGLSASTFTLFADTGDEAVVALDHDRNGDLFLVETDEIYKIDRATGAISLWTTLTHPGVFNAMTIVQETNMMYVGTYEDGTVGSSGVIEFDLAAGPSPGTMIGDLQALGFDGRITGMDDAFGLLLYITTLDDANGQSVVLYDVASGFAFVAPGAPLRAINGVYYDRKNLLAHLVTGGSDPTVANTCFDFSGATNDYLTLEIGGATLTTIPGNPMPPEMMAHDVTFNDLLDLTAVFPQAPSVTADFLFEGAAHGNPGDPAGLALVAVGGLPVPPKILGLGVCDSGGFYSVQAPVSSVGLSPGDSFTIQGARFDLTTGAIVFGSSVDVVMQP